MILTRDRYFYKTAINIAIPIAIQNLITFSVSMADTVMLGTLGEVSLSASAIGNHLVFFLMVLMFGVGGGASVMASQYYGKKDISSIHKIIAIMYRVCIVLAVVFTIIAITVPNLFMKIYTNDIEVVKEGVFYLRIIGLSYIFYSLTNCTISILRSIKTVKISLVVYSASLLINISLNYILIFGKFGFPQLGIKGAAIATVISRIVEFMVVVIYMKFFEKKIELKLKNIIKIDKKILKDYTKVCTPIILNELFWAIGSTIISIIVGRMGRAVVAANSINNVTFQFASLFIFGLASASSVIIGNTIGEGEYKKVKEYADTICILSVIMGVVSGFVIYYLRPVVVSFYNVSNETKAIAMQIMISTSIVAVFKSITSNIMMGVLRGGGDNKFVFKMEMLFLWLVSIPLGFLSAFVWKLPIFIVFLVIKIDEVFKAISGLIRVKRGKWIKDITRQ
ncbi:MAG: MATE family efflux transporter [Peptostreptococcaceae bacterium]